MHSAADLVLTGLSPAKLSAAVEFNSAEWLRLEGRLPWVEYHDDGDAVRVFAGDTWPRNSVALARFTPATAHRRVGEILARHLQQKVACNWIVGPMSQPTDLGRHLRAHGFKCMIHCAGMAVIVLLAAVLPVAIVFVTQDRGPIYKGRTVIGWTQEPSAEIPADVINALGPEATPYLISAWQQKPTMFNKAAWFVWRKLPRSLYSRLWKYAPVDVPGSASRAADWLKALGPDAHEAIPALTETALKHPDRFQRSSAINTLGLVGARSPEVLRALTTLLEDADDVVRDAATLAIAPSGTNGVTAVPTLIQIVKSRPKPFNALLTLAFIGPPAREAVPVIVERLKESELRGNAPVLARHLKSDDSLCLFYGLETLGEMGRNASSIAPVLADFISTKSNSWSSRRQALRALERIDPESARKLQLR